MPSSPNYVRDYKQEYRTQHASRKAKRDRAARNRARRAALRKGTVHKGDNKDIHHVVPLAKGGSRDGKTRVVSRSTNRSFKRTKTAGMA